MWNKNCIFILMNGACVSCLNVACVRLRLRNCTHICCVSCILTHLQHFIHLKAKVLIRCVDPNCPVEIHENDINAVLDPQEDALDVFVGREERQFLQYYHNKDCIIYAIAGPNPQDQDVLIKRCPLCKTIYTRFSGCHNVICANTSCKTRFCWTCEKPIIGFRHFTGNHHCLLGSKDVDRSLFVLRFLRDVSPCALVAGLPIFFMFCLVIFPLMIIILLPLTHTLHTIKKGHERYNFLTTPERIILAGKVAVGLIILIPLSIPVSVLAYPTALGLCLAYIVITFLKYVPCTRKLFNNYDKFLPFAGRFGLHHYKQMLKESREQPMDEERNPLDVERERMKLMKNV